MSKTALVTGASSGLGLEFARILAREGYNLVLVARSEDKLSCVADQLRNTFGHVVSTVAADLSDPLGPAKVADFTERAGLHIDLLVNNAGFGDCAEFAECDINKQKQMIDLNVRALVDLTYYYLGPMLDAGEGEILNVASVAAFEPGPGMPVYFATKAFVLSFTEAIAEELRGTGVKACALCPGTTDTAFWDVAEAGNLSVLRQFVIAQPDQVAEYGIKSLHRGRVVAVAGIGNKLSTASVRFLPRPIVRRIMHVLLKKN